MENNVSLDLMEFVEQQILPRYNAFGHSHGLRHVLRVIKNSLVLAKITGPTATWHTWWLPTTTSGCRDPEPSTISRGKILMADARLKRWFSPEQIKIMKEAVEDHRPRRADNRAASMAR